MAKKSSKKIEHVAELSAQSGAVVEIEVVAADQIGADQIAEALAVVGAPGITADQNAEVNERFNKRFNAEEVAKQLAATEVVHPAEHISTSPTAKSPIDLSGLNTSPVQVLSVYVKSVHSQFSVGDEVQILANCTTVPKKFLGMKFIIAWLGKERLALRNPAVNPVDGMGNPVPFHKLHLYPKYSEVLHITK